MQVFRLSEHARLPPQHAPPPPQLYHQCLFLQSQINSSLSLAVGRNGNQDGKGVDRIYKIEGNGVGEVRE